MSKHTYSRIYLRIVRTTGFTLIISAFSIIGLTASTWAWLKSNRTPGPPNTIAQKSEPAAHDSPQNGQAQRQVEAVRILIRPTGFEPSEINRPAKPFLLVVDNKSGLDELELQIQRVKAGHRDKLREIKITLKQLRKAEITDLPSGQYELKEANHPDWVCRISLN